MGVLKAKVGGTWTEIGAVGTDEVNIGPTTPVDAAVELWYDTSANPTLTPWASYTPTLTQSAVITKTVVTATYIQIGKLVICSVAMNVTSAGTAGFGVRVGLPIAARAANAVFGVGQLYDSSTGIRYVCGMFGLNTVEAAFGIDGASSDVWGASPNLAIASGDQMNYNISYEAA